MSADGEKERQDPKGAPPPPEGPEGHDTLADLSKDALREIESRDDGSGGNAGRGDGG